MLLFSIAIILINILGLKEVMPEYIVEKGPRYGTLTENSVHKREIDALIGKKLDQNSLEKVIQVLSYPLHVRTEDLANFKEMPHLFDSLTIYYDHAPGFEVAEIKIS